MITEDSFTLIPLPTEEQLTREKHEDYLRGLLNEKGYCETRIAQLNVATPRNEDEEKRNARELAAKTRQLQNIKDELALIGESSAPASRVRK